MKQIILNNNQEVACIENAIILPNPTVISTNLLLTLPLLQYLNPELNINETDLVYLSTPTPDQKTPHNLKWLNINTLTTSNIKQEDLTYIQSSLPIIKRMLKIK